jgi:hypothetical protein
MIHARGKRGKQERAEPVRWRLDIQRQIVQN